VETPLTLSSLRDQALFRKDGVPPSYDPSFLRRAVRGHFSLGASSAAGFLSAATSSFSAAERITGVVGRKTGRAYAPKTHRRESCRF